MESKRLKALYDISGAGILPKQIVDYASVPLGRPPMKPGGSARLPGNNTLWNPSGQSLGSSWMFFINATNRLEAYQNVRHGVFFWIQGSNSRHAWNRKLCITKGREMALLECTSRMEYMRTTHLEEELCFVYRENVDALRYWILIILLYKGKTIEK